MAPFNEALKFVPENDVSEPSSTTVYKGTSDPEWVVGSVPNGGESSAYSHKLLCVYRHLL